MLFDHELTGDGLPERTLCLTFDDGPGPQTAELGSYLAGRGIAATFFLIGQHARTHPEVAAGLRAAGHLVGNHTETHPTLVSFHRDGGDVVAELARAETAIGAPGPGELTFFRAPYGDWRDDGPLRDPTLSSVAAALHASGRFPGLVGPVGWDVDARDWQFWRDGRPAEACGQAYLDAVEATGRGIVLMHDSAETPELRAGNRVLELVEWLVPRLEERGYRFARLDAVPGVASAALVGRQVMFVTGFSRYLVCPVATPRLALTPDVIRPGGRARFGLVPVGSTKRGEIVGLRASNGRFVAATRSGELAAESIRLDDSARWELVPVRPTRFELRDADGRSLQVDDRAGIVRVVRRNSAPLHFTVEPVGPPGL